MRDRLPPVWHGYLTRELQKLITRIKAGEVPDWSQDTVGPEYEAVEVSVELLGPDPEPVPLPRSVVEAEEQRFARAHGLYIPFEGPPGEEESARYLAEAREALAVYDWSEDPTDDDD